MSKEILCPISQMPMKEVFSETVMGKYAVKYYFSEESGLIKTENPYWLDEAYETAINDADVGLIAQRAMS